MKRHFFIGILVVSLLQWQQPKPVLYIIGDSTVRNNNQPQCGWGQLMHEFLDTSRISISNQAMAGRSTRTFVKEKRWEKVISSIRPGDFLLIQFGHNEGSKPDTSKAGYRGVLRGTGEDSLQLTWPDGTIETVHSYGWYLRTFIRETKAKGATPIVCSMIPRNQWDYTIKGDTTSPQKVRRAGNDFGKWAREVAAAEGVDFIDLNSITADKYDQMGPAAVKMYFPGDHTHTNETGARVNAASVVAGIRLLKQSALQSYIKNRNT